MEFAFTPLHGQAALCSPTDDMSEAWQKNGDREYDIRMQRRSCARPKLGRRFDRHRRIVRAINAFPNRAPSPQTLRPKRDRGA